MPNRVALVSCVKLKQSTAAPACELYISPLFRGLRQYAEKYADAWYILSAEHGLLSPQEPVAPYERTLNQMHRKERQAWATRVNDQLLEILPPDAEIIMLAGARYRRDIEPFLQGRGFKVLVPLEGLAIGQQLRALKRANSE